MGRTCKVVERKAERRRGERRRTTLKRNPGVLSSVGLEHNTMSADNIIYVKKHRRKWKVWEQSASCDPKPHSRAQEHATKEKALVAAHKLQDKTGFVEYGVNVL